MNLADLLRPASVVLLDFDGPTCDLFAGYPANVIADEIRALVAKHGHTVSATGPDSLLLEVANLGDPILTRTVADAVRDAEIVASASAQPTPGAVELLRTAADTGRRVAIVSNNSVEAVQSYVGLHGLVELLDLVVGRDDGMDPYLLKPDPHLVRLALNNLATDARAAIFIGDQTTDVKAGRAAGVPTIGYANKPGKRERFQTAGAVAIVDDLRQLAKELRGQPGTRTPVS